MLNCPTAEGGAVRRRVARRPAVIAALALAYLVAAVFFPILGFEFVNIDVEEQVIHNPYIRGLTGENLRHILTSRCIHSYYPVRTLSFALDYQIWGLNPLGFKLTNALIHLANVLLLFWLILRLFQSPVLSGGSHPTWKEVLIAAFSAAIFAVHPVVVEPVTWVAGREELLMTLGALGCIHFHLSARRLAEQGRSTTAVVAFHTCAAVCCAWACLSNAVAAAIPLLIVTWDALTLSRPRFWKILAGSLALWIIAAATVVIKKLGSDPRATGFQPELFSAEWVALILSTYWVNLQTLAWPTNLTISYSRFRPEGLLAPQVVLGALAIGLTVAALWRLRRQKPVVCGLAWFLIALAPASQVMAHHVHRADRFLYLPLAGLALAAAAGLKPLSAALRGKGPWAGAMMAGGAGVFVLVTVSASQVQTWRSSRTLWQHCLEVDPNNATAHDLFGKLLKEQGDWQLAEEHFRRAMELDADNPDVLQAVALQMASFEDQRMRNYPEAIRLARRACELTKWKDVRHRHTLATVYALLAASQADHGSFAPAIENYRHAIQTHPTLAPAFYNLALILATCPQTSLRNPQQAVSLAEKAYHLTEDAGAEHVRVLLDVYASAGRFDKAVATAEQALQSARAAGNRALENEFRDRLQSLRSAPRNPN